MSRPLAEIAAEIWPILCRQAAGGRPLTYGELGRAVGFPARHLGRPLGHVHAFCRERGLPPLHRLVTARDGVPGAGYRDEVGDLDRALAEVVSYRWADLPAPLPGDLQGAWERWRSGLT